MPKIDLTDPETKQEFEEALAAKLAEETAGLKGNQQKLLDDLKKAQAKLKEMPEGFDPEEWRKLKEAEAKRTEDEAKKAGEWDRLKAEMIQKHQKDVDAITTERDSLRKRYEDHVIRSEVVSAIAKANGVPDILFPKVREAVKFIPGENGAEDAVVVVGKDGNPRIKDAKGTVYGLGDLLDELKNDDVWSRGFNASGASGGGAGGSKGSGGGASRTIKRAEFDGMSDADKAKHIADGGVIAD